MVEMVRAATGPDCGGPRWTETDGLLDDRAFARVAHALAHPARVTIVRRLAAGDECVAAEIFDEIDLAQSTVSQHLRVLREAEVVRSSAQGNRTYYCVNRATLERFEKTLAEVSLTSNAHRDAGAGDRG